MKYDVFISYSTSDQKIVEGLCAFLEQKKIRCFVAYRDIPKGMAWPSAIVRALESSRTMVVVYSEMFNLSEETDREIVIASNLHIPILTFRLSDSEFVGTKKYYLENLNWIDAFPNPQNAFGDIAFHISNLLKDKETCAFNDCKAMSDELNTIKLAELGVPSAQFNLGMSYLTKADYSHAIKWFAKSAEQGHIRAQVQLGICYAQGLGINQSEDKAYYWWLKAAEEGDENAISFVKSMQTQRAFAQYKKDGETALSFLKQKLEHKADIKYRLIIRFVNLKNLSTLSAIKKVLGIGLMEAKKNADNTPSVIYESSDRYDVVVMSKKFDKLLPNKGDIVLDIEESQVNYK